MARQLKERNYGGGRYTYAGLMGWLRSGLRRMSRRWKPIYDCLADAKRPYTGGNNKQRWEYQCAVCKQWFIQRQVSVDHIVPAGSLRTLDDLPGFVGRLFCEKEHLQVLCHGCHDTKTKEDNDGEES